MPSIAKLITKSRSWKQPQRPGFKAEDYRELIVAMVKKGHNAPSIAAFLVSEGEITADRQHTVAGSIRNFIAKISAE